MRAISLLFHDVYRRAPAESGFRSPAADRYKLSIADFDSQLAGVASVRPDAPMVVRDSRLLPALSPYTITFDDGGVSYHTLIAERLEARGWRGHCFVSTDFIGQPGFLDAAQLRELDARGHVIGSHSASHPPRFSACPFDQMVSEWRRSRETLEQTLGHRVVVASVPGGYFSPAVALAAGDAGIEVLFTSEPVTAIQIAGGITVAGRFTIREGDPRDFSGRLVGTSSLARARAWASWNAKGLIKPLLGGAYIRLAHWVHAQRQPRPSIDRVVSRLS